MTRPMTRGPRYHTPSPLAFARDAAEVAAEASEDSLAREVAASTFRPRYRPRKASRGPLHKAAWGTAHVTAVSGVTGATFYTGNIAVLLFGLTFYTLAAALVASAQEYGGFGKALAATDD